MMPVPKLETITPPDLDLSELYKALEEEGKSIQRSVAKDFHRTTATWNHKPAFRSPAVSASGTEMVMDVFTGDQIYQAVNDGTKDRVAVLSEGLKAFKIPLQYTPKTLPGVINSFHAGASEDFAFYNLKTMTSRIAPRKFDTAIADKWRPMIPQRLQSAMDKAASKINHSL